MASDDVVEALAKELAEEIVQRLHDSAPTALADAAMDRLRGGPEEACFVIEPNELRRFLAVSLGNAAIDGFLTLHPTTTSRAARREGMEEAARRLVRSEEDVNWDDGEGPLQKEIDALRTALDAAPEVGEPVAWGMLDGNGMFRMALSRRESVEDEANRRNRNEENQDVDRANTVVPLYARPTPPPADDLVSERTTYRLVRVECETCKGTGEMSVLVGVEAPDEKEVYDTEECAECGGTGTVKRKLREPTPADDAVAREEQETLSEWGAGAILVILGLYRDKMPHEVVAALQTVADRLGNPLKEPAS